MILPSIRSFGAAPRPGAFGARAVAPLLVLATTVAAQGDAESLLTSPPPQAPPLRLDTGRVAALAAEIDGLVGADLAAAHVAPNPPADDATFVRRAYLQLLGRIPTAAEATSFFDDPDRDKRAALVDRLLVSPGHASGELQWWADLLRVKSKLAPQTSGEPWIAWLQEQLARDVPYDEIVRAMLTASGPAHERGHAATGYLLRDRGMPLDSMANTARVFLGTRIECAQCHDHPFDAWTQRQFYELAAHFGGLDYRSDGVLAQSDVHSARALARQIEADMGREGVRALRRLTRGAMAGISGDGTAALPLPDDFRGKDGSPGEVVAARTLFGDVVSTPEEAPRSRRHRRRPPPMPEVGSRAAFADWLTAADNPRFAAVAANRLWARMMGRGLVEPIDDWRDDREPVDPALLHRLTRLLVELDFDLRELQRVVAHTQTWQRQAVTAALDPAVPFHFEGPLLRRLTAEQLWDSLVTLVVGDPDAMLTDPAQRAEEVYRQFDELAGMTEADLLAQVRADVERAGDPDGQRAMRRGERAARRAELLSDLRAKRDEARTLRHDLGRAKRARDRKKVVEIEARLEVLADLKRRVVAHRDGMLRASELSSPAPPEHLLRAFGQSDREQIDASHDDATVPQALALLNGFVQDHVLQTGAVVHDEVTKTEDADERIERAFVAVLARRPSTEERRTWQQELYAHGDGALDDLLWVLCNSHEFRLLR